MGKKRKNPGHFRRGHDPRRHILTTEERSRGGKAAFVKLMNESPSWLAWFQRRIDQTSHPETLAAYRQRRGRGD